MLRSLWLNATVGVVKCARIAPKRFSHHFDTLALKMVSGASRLKRMSRRACRMGEPFLAYAQCEDMDCRHCWTVVSLGQVDPKADLVCPVCDQETGVIL